MKYTHQNKGTCSKEVTFEIEGGTLKNIEFYGGCDGNLKAVAKLLEGMPVAFAQERLRGLKCGNKQTSCADQLVKGIDEALTEG